MKKPQRSTKYANEWLVRVADSTTAPHSTDSRYDNDQGDTVKEGSSIYNQSSYRQNRYTAWTKRYNKGDAYHWYEPFKKHTSDDWLELCDADNGNTFHRRYAEFDEKSKHKIYPQTTHTNSSTGIGIGYIYVSDDMKYYRVKKGADREYAGVYIGRPVVKTSQ